MGELSSAGANRKRASFVQVYENISKKVEDEFKDMDFENADKRTTVHEIVGVIQSECDKQINYLNGLTFE